MSRVDVWVEHVDTSNLQIPAFATQKFYHGETKGILTPRRRVARRSTADCRAGKYRATQIRGNIESPVTISSAPSASCLRHDPSGNAHLRLFRGNFLFPELPFRTPPRLRFVKTKTTL